MSEIFVRPELVVFLSIFFFLQGCSSAAKMPTDKNPVKYDYDVIVVGGGLGGLTAGAELARSGLSVLLLEQHYKVGGCTTSFEREEFNFDAALHQLSLGVGEGAVKTILQDLGAWDKMVLIQSPELARTIFPNMDFVAPASEKDIVAAFKNQWPKEADGIDRFFELAADISNEMIELTDLYRENRFVGGLQKILIPFKQPKLFKWRNATLKEVLDHFFKDPMLKGVIAQYWLYFGPPPSKVWAPGFLLGYYSYVQNGAWQIKGSSQAMSDAVADSLTQAGGKIMTSSRVSKIDVDGNGIKGITLADGQTFSSRYVVSNADPFQTFFGLVGRENVPADFASDLENTKPSNSLAGVYLGLDVEPSFWGIKEYEIFYHTTTDLDAIYESMVEGRFDEGAVSLTFYSNLNDPFYAPKGKSVLVLNAYSDVEYWPERGPEYYKLKAKMEDQLLTLAENILPGLREHIIVQEGMTPRTIETFVLHHNGVPYGFDLTPRQWSGMSNRTPINGLFLAGSWANPLHGTGGAIISGHKAARLIKDIEENEQ